MSTPEVIRNVHLASAPFTYSDLDLLQMKIAERVRAGGKGAILISQVAPVITLGKRADDSELLLPKAAYEKAGVQILKTNRGGLATYHGPGQWVLFVVDKVERLTGNAIGVRQVIEGLLRVAVNSIAALGTECIARDGCELGVWSKMEKLASVGIQIDRKVVQHGLCINGFRTAESFLGINPCGLAARPGFCLPDHSRFDELGRAIVSSAKSVFYSKSS